jgi:hypothetical protein
MANCPNCLDRLITLRRKVLIVCRIAIGLRFLHAVPLSDANTLGLPHERNSLSPSAGGGTTTGSGDRSPHLRGIRGTGEAPELRNDFGRFSSASASALVGPAIRLSSSATKHPIWGRHATLRPGKLPRAGDGERKPRPAGAPIPGVVAGSPPAHPRAHPRTTRCSEDS